MPARPRAARAGGGRGHRAVALAGRRPLHVHGLSRVRPRRQHPARSRATAQRAGSVSSPWPAPASASCAPTRHRDPTWDGCRARPATARVNASCSSSPRPTAARRCTGRPTSTTSVSRRSTSRAPSWASDASSACSRRPPTTRASRRSPSCAARRSSSSGASGSARPATRARTCCRSSRPIRATSCSRSPAATWLGLRSLCCICRSAGSCGCSCDATTTAASCRAWSTCRVTATRPTSGRRWRTSSSTRSTA